MQCVQPGQGAVSAGLSAPQSTTQKHHVLCQVLLEKLQGICNASASSNTCDVEQPRNAPALRMPTKLPSFCISVSNPGPVAAVCGRAQGDRPDTPVLVQYWPGPSLQEADALLA